MRAGHNHFDSGRYLSAPNLVENRLQKQGRGIDFVRAQPGVSRRDQSACAAILRQLPSRRASPTTNGLEQIMSCWNR
jgi:hypothetical protein